MKQIGEGAFREIYIMDDNPNLCIKKLKKERKKTYFGIDIFFKQKIYTLLKYGIIDFNEYDYSILKKAQKIIPENTPDYIEITNEGLVESLIKDYNGDISKNITQYNGKLGVEFFDKLTILVDFLVKNGIEPMNVAHNVIVQEYEKGKFKPILFDFKRIGGRTYIFQPWLTFSKHLRERKIYTRLSRMKEKFI